MRYGFFNGRPISNTGLWQQISKLQKFRGPFDFEIGVMNA